LLVKEVAERKQAAVALRDNEEKYRRLFENELFAICIFDLETLHFLDVNDTHTKLYGYSREELLGGMVATDLSAEPEASVKSIQEVRASGPMHVSLRYHKKKDGTVFPTEIVAGPYVFKGRRVMYGIGQDISERLQLEEKLRLSEEKYRSLVETTSDCIWEVDPHGRFTYLSPKFEELLGYDPTDFLGHSPEELIPEEEAPQPAEHFRAVVNAKQPFSLVEHYNRHRDGRQVAVDVRGVPVFTADGEYKGMRGITRDVTVRRQAEDTVRLHLAVMETVAEGIFLIGVDDNIIKWTNRKLEQMFGYDPGEMVGMHVDKVNAPTENPPRKLESPSLTCCLKPESGTERSRTSGKTGRISGVMPMCLSLTIPSSEK
jgi:PAS domain S-box-containing protein